MFAHQSNRILTARSDPLPEALPLSAGTKDAQKRRFLEQLRHLDGNYAGGLPHYMENAKRLLRDARDGNLLRCCLSDASRFTNMSHCHVSAGFYPKYSITATDFLCPTTCSVVVKLEKALVLVSISCLIQPHPPFSYELLLLLCVASLSPLQRYLTLLARTLAGKNPFDGFTPSVPHGLKLDYGSQEFQELEAQGPCSLLVHAPFPQRSPCP